jgi:glycine oxidase
VRGASPDSLPMAGRVGEGLHLALAPRRNGWLLGPLAALAVADAVEQRPPHPLAAALDPLRFSLPEG